MKNKLFSTTLVIPFLENVVFDNSESNFLEIVLLGIFLSFGSYISIKILFQGDKKNDLFCSIKKLFNEPDNFEILRIGNAFKVVHNTLKLEIYSNGRVFINGYEENLTPVEKSVLEEKIYDLIKEKHSEYYEAIIKEAKKQRK